MPSTGERADGSLSSSPAADARGGTKSSSENGESRRDDLSLEGGDGRGGGSCSEEGAMGRTFSS